MLDELRHIVCDLHMELPRNNLVAWTSGNISARDPERNLVVIKPSGIKFDDLTPENMVVVDINGELVEGDEVEVSTWLGEAKGARYGRHIDIRKPGAAKPSASVHTVWGYIDTETRRPKRVPPEVFETFGLSPAG